MYSPEQVDILLKLLYKKLDYVCYCCPSGFNELRPALKISSVDRRLTAITELDHNISEKWSTEHDNEKPTTSEASAS